MKNPLIGSVTSARSTSRLSACRQVRHARAGPVPLAEAAAGNVAAADDDVRLRRSAAPPACAAAAPRRAAGRRPWRRRRARGCTRTPSMNAEARPRRPRRCSRRTRLSVRPIAATASRVPSVEPSSTKTTSQAMPSSVARSRSTSGATLSRSLSTGTTTHSSGAGRVTGSCARGADLSWAWMGSILCFASWPIVVYRPILEVQPSPVPRRRLSRPRQRGRPTPRRRPSSSEPHAELKDWFPFIRRIPPRSRISAKPRSTSLARSLNACRATSDSSRARLL